LGKPNTVKWGLRAILAALVILSLGLKFAAPYRATQDVEPISGLASVLGSHLSGPMSHKGWGSAENPSWIITAPVTGCREPLTIVTVIPPSFNAAVALASFERPGDRHYFAYLDWISSQPDRWGLLRLRIWQRAQQMLHASAYGSPRVMLYIIESSDCRVVEAVSWRKYWLAGR